MIITIVCDVLGEENNGTTIAAMNLIRSLKAGGHKVRVVCGDAYRKGEEGFYIVPNVNLGKMLNNYVKKIGVTLSKPDSDVIKSAILGSDIVHIMLPLPVGLTALKIAKENNIPVTAGFHMMAENLTTYIKMNKLRPLNNFVYKFIYKHLYSQVDAIHYPTAFIRNLFEKKIKHKTNGYVISNGVNPSFVKIDVEKPDILKDKIVITTTGRYSREKSQDTLLKAIKYSKFKNDIQLILAGQGIKEKYYKKLGAKLPNYPIFKLYTRKELIELLNYSDMYVLTSEVELEGIACLESIACGKLTLTADSALSAGKTFAPDERCVFKKRNPKDLAKVIDFWIEHPAIKEECEQKYLDMAPQFNQEKCMKAMENMLKEVVNAKKNSD